MDAQRGRWIVVRYIGLGAFFLLEDSIGGIEMRGLDTVAQVFGIVPVAQHETNPGITCKIVACATL